MRQALEAQHVVAREIYRKADKGIALLAPQVRNEGVIFAQKGTVALAAGEAYELQFDGTRLANVRVQPGVMEQYRPLHLGRLVQVVLDATAVVTHGRIDRATGCQLVTQAPAHAEADRAHLAAHVGSGAQGIEGEQHGQVGEGVE